jgi:hypothetical protein
MRMIAHGRSLTPAGAYAFAGYQVKRGRNVFSFGIDNRHSRTSVLFLRNAPGVQAQGRSPAFAASRKVKLAAALAAAAFFKPSAREKHRSCVIGLAWRGLSVMGLITVIRRRRARS